MEKLLFFLLGILFYEIILPILSEIGNVILGRLQLIQGKQAAEMVKYNKIVEEYKEEQSRVDQPQAIGFEIPFYSNDQEDEDDE